MSRPKTFSETIRPILLLNIVLCSGSLVLSKQQKMRKCTESVSMVIALLYYNVLFSVHIIYANALIETQGRLHYFMEPLLLALIYSSMTVLIIITKFKTKTIQDLFEDIDTIDQNMQTLGLPNQYVKEYKNRMYYIGSWVFFSAASLVTTWMFRIGTNIPIVLKIILCVDESWIHLSTSAVQLAFTCWVGSIRTKFTLLNNLLEDMIETLDRPGPKRFLEIRDYHIQKRTRLDAHVLKGNVEIIAKAKSYHLDLIRIARRVNKLFGMQLLLTTFVWIVTTVSLLYVINFDIWSMSQMYYLYELGPSIIWLMITIPRMIYLHNCCVWTTNEAERTGFLLCRLYDSSISIKFRAEVQRFTHQVLENPLVFNICGLVDIDHTFLASMSGSVFAYLIVIIQLGAYLLDTNVATSST